MAALSLEKVEAFMAVGSGYGYGSGSGSGDGSGYGSGDGYGSGSGSGDGYGSGSGDGSGYGDGDGYGDGYGSGSGYGYGYGSGSGDGSGYGSGDGSGYGITTFCGDAVRRVDGLYTVLHAIHGNTAKASILGGDFTLNPCYVIKSGRCFAHGETIQQAQKALEVKLFSRMPVEEKIEEFLKTFDLSKKHPAKSFYDWHNRLTGSCEMGRKTFAKEHGIDIEKDEMTVDAFIKLTRNAFGGSVIQQLEERIGEHAKPH